MPQVHGSLKCPGVVLSHGAHGDMVFCVSTYPRVKDNRGCLMFLTILLLEFG